MHASVSGRRVVRRLVDRDIARRLASTDIDWYERFAMNVLNDENQPWGLEENEKIHAPEHQRRSQSRAFRHGAGRRFLL